MLTKAHTAMATATATGTGTTTTKTRLLSPLSSAHPHALSTRKMQNVTPSLELVPRGSIADASATTTQATTMRATLGVDAARERPRASPSSTASRRALNLLHCDRVFYSK